MPGFTSPVLHCSLSSPSPVLTTVLSLHRSLDLSKFCIGRKGEQQLPMYDLYAVINHYGGMIGGHYTAYARLPSDKNSQRSDVGEDLLASPSPSPAVWPVCLLNPALFTGWRLFDDSTVTTVDESQVVTRYAYVLFYRRRNSPVERPLPGHPQDHRAERTPSAEATASQVRTRIPFGAVGTTEP